jgi:hypothetical protein
MSYFIFLKNLDNIEGSIYKIAENQSDLNNLNINQPDYKIIQESINNFNNVKLGNKFPTKYNNDIITFKDQIYSFINKEELQNYIDGFKNQIKQFTDNNPNHPLFSRWNNYYTQLNNLNLEIPTYPLNKSLEQYFIDLGQPSLNPLQLP